MSLVHSYIKHLGVNSRIYSMQELDDLLSAEDHPDYMKKHRAILIGDRVRFVASLFTLLIPLWIIVDYILLPLDVLLPIVVIRLISTGHFYYLSRYKTAENDLKKNLLVLGGLLINLPLTFFASAHFLTPVTDQEMGHLALQLYTILPYVAIGLIGLFPLSVIEGMVISLLLVLLTITGWSYYATVPVDQIFAMLWLLCIILGVVLFAATLQLQYMIALITRADHDPVTGAQTRKSGMQSLVKAFEQAHVHGGNLSIALVDLDNVENIITEFDYATYDHVVVEAADILHDDLRHSDMLVRWGEKVFLLLLPGTDCDGAAITVKRIHNKGLGTLPDGSPVTASISVCERVADHIEEWSQMLEVVNERRDNAKHEGKDRYFLCGDKVVQH
ncbi:MAG: GGDEF domain-containing protein [Candidatus Thiodiazotropha taylori]|nr:GGDEF domain-containing protein [Candidatus Thiodiazotropha taylori]